MAKDVNIHVKATGTGETKQQLDDVGKKAQQLGQKTAEGQKQAAESTEQATGKLTGMGRIMDRLKSQVIGFLAGWLGIQGVLKLISLLNEKLERTAQLQGDIYQKSLSLAEIGQRLEFQAGTRGQQQFWTQQALQLQQAGGFASPQTAQQMLVSMDIAFGAQGGIKNQQILDLAQQLAPFIGAAGLGPEEVAKVFEFAGTAGIAPTAPDYKQYFAQLQAGFTASKATDFGQFMMGLQKGGTAYMAMGGTLPEAISAFSAARAVMANESLAANLLEQVARLSGGGYEKPRMAMEKKLGVKWGPLSMDQRMAALLQYVQSIPEAERAQNLAKQGFPVELTTQMGKMVSPEAQQTMKSTREQVVKATASMIDELTNAYLDSYFAKEQISKAKIAEKETLAAPAFADWQTRLKEAQTDVGILIAEGRDRWMRDSLEPYVLALERMRDELLLEGKPPTEGPEKELYTDINEFLRDITGESLPRHLKIGAIFQKYVYPSGPVGIRGWEYTQRLKAIKEGAEEMPVTIINYYNQRNNFPVAGYNKEDLGIGPPVPREIQ